MIRRLLVVSLVLAGWVAALAAPAVASAAFGPLSFFGSSGSAAGQLQAPGSLAIASDGSLYVAGYGNHRIDVFGPGGEFKFAFGRDVDGAGGEVCTTATGCQPGQATGAAGAMHEPESVAIDGEGRIFVDDQTNNRIDVFGADGTFLYAFGKGVNPAGGDICTTECQVGTATIEGGGLNHPEGLGISGSTVYVADSANYRISTFTTSGTFLYAFGAEVNADGSNVCFAGESCEEGNGGEEGGEIAYPYDVKIGPDGLLTVAENEGARLSVFTPQGAFVRAIGKEVNAQTSGDICPAGTPCQAGTRDGGVASLLEPNALSIDAAGDVFVADNAANRIDEFAPDGSFVKAWGAGVVDGAQVFEICTAATGCQPGLEGEEFPGAVSEPFGVAADCQGGIWTVDAFGIVERFAEEGTPPATSCPVSPPAPPANDTGGGGGPSTKTAPPAPVAPSNLIKLGKVKLDKKRGTATLAVTVPDPGKLVLSGKGLKKATKATTKAGTVSLIVKAVGKAKKKLARIGKVKVRAQVTFTPTGGTAASKTKSLVLKKG